MIGTVPEALLVTCTVIFIKDVWATQSTVIIVPYIAATIKVAWAPLLIVPQAPYAM